MNHTFIAPYHAAPRQAGVSLPERYMYAFRHWAARSWAKQGLPDLVSMRHTTVETTRIHTAMTSQELAQLHAGASPVARLLALADLRGPAADG